MNKTERKTAQKKVMEEYENNKENVNDSTGRKVTGTKGVHVMRERNRNSKSPIKREDQILAEDDTKLNKS